MTRTRVRVKLLNSYTRPGAQGAGDERDPHMNVRFLTLLIVALLLVPAGALAVEGDAAVDLAELCYVDPMDERCLAPNVIERPPVVEPVVVVARPVVDEPEVLGVTLRQPALPVTGSNMGFIALVAAALLAVGATTLGVTRRRTRGSARS
jgi:hypothetical protein